MTKFELLAASAMALMFATPALAQEAPIDSDTSSQQGDASDAGSTSALDDAPPEDIVVTAQRQSQRLQDVPIAVSAFTGEALEQQQIKTASDLQLSLPNVTFTKSNFTGATFTIRGIGDLCVGVSCDAATAIHLNDEPVFGTRIFETEFYDIERVEVLRGPQGTLFGRNATAGVVNITTAKPDLSGFSASGQAEYGNFDSYKAQGHLNLPISETLGVRVAGYFLNRDGYTRNVFDGSRVDDRDLYSIRGTIRFEPSADTTFDLLGSYFHERDNRLRIQKQLCQRDPTGVLGCLPGRLEAGAVNTNATFAPGTLPSREFLTIALGDPNLAAFGLGSVYGPDANSGFVNPADLRTINSDFTPTYFAEELQIQGKFKQRVGDFNLSLSGTYQDTSFDSREDYLLSVTDRSIAQPGIDTLAAAAAGLIPGLPAAYFAPIAAALIPNGPTGVLCTSDAETTGTGAYGGFSQCSQNPSDFDRSVNESSAYSVEAIVSSDFDGAFNFLLGGIYADVKVTENSYYVNSFYIDYLSGILGTFTALGNVDPVTGAPAPLPPSYLATPYFRSNTADFKLKSYGIFGEGYVTVNDELKLTLGIRYNNDSKRISARSTLASFLAPFGSTDAFASPFVGSYDADPGRDGVQAFQVRDVDFDEFTGRAVIDYQVTPDNLLYASYSRGYKSGGINPPLQPIFAVPDSFRPEFIDAFEIGSKNQFVNGKVTLNANAFYYKYKDLQLSRIVSRTSVNDNVDADIYGVELEALIRPARNVQVNFGGSYLHTEVKSSQLFSNPRDPSGGRSDVVIIKDLSNGANCAVGSDVGSASAVNGFVGAVNGGLGLLAPTPFPAGSGIAATGAFGICEVLAAQAASPTGAAFGGITYFSAGVPVSLRGNELPQSPTIKASAGVQYTATFANGYTLVPRADIAYTGEFYAQVFNLNVDKVDGYAQVNAQLQLNAPDERFFVRGFIQNIFNDDSITGQYVTDASSGLFTNVFVLEPRRYGIAAGFKF